ncbi:MAG: hypothetical protein AUK48_14145 [Oscillatoriales cyanobacterium CG2_30_44_21]|nr:MAG: hypothetical protein AUK48_14145 [Oscillatoriales cyanobacterium CG2_30_44_21]
MVNERLDFRDPHYKTLDIVDHLARYSVVKSLCENKNVLDAACGEGYGSFLMAEFWSAKSVTAIDISEVAIKSAKENFESSKINYICHDLGGMESFLDSESFDLVVSLETVEHLKDPDFFIKSIKTVLKPNGIVVISCPNDYWWYQDQIQDNPYHLHKYSLSEFQELCERHLGSVSQIMLGTSVIGIGNIDLYSETTSNISSKSIINNLKYADTQRLPISDGVDPEKCSYFLCVWGSNGQKIKENFIVYPSLLELYRQYGYYLNNNSLEKHLTWLESRVKNLDNEIKYFQLQLQEYQFHLKEHQLKIADMENTKFWKLRNLWVKLKEIINFRSAT